MKLSRRTLLRNLGAVAGSAALLGLWKPGYGASSHPGNTRKHTARNLFGSELKGNINHSVTRWPYGGYSLDELCAAAKDIGIQSIELLGPDDWPVLKQHGLDCAMTNGAELGLERGFNNPAYHDELEERYNEMIPKVAEAGFQQLICFSGNRDGMDDEEGAENCAEGLRRIVGTAERHNVILSMELLNSKIDHPDYQCDKTPWGVSVCDMVGSDNLKLLYDIYHMQIMEGDVIRTITDYHDYISHYHTGGVPGRNEIDETQELYYPAIMRAIHETGFDGYVGQEFIPTWDDPMEALAHGVQVCDI